MKTFLAHYVLITRQYMETGSKKEGKNTIVEAESEDKAKKTLEKYWDNLSNEFGTTFTPDNIEISQSISQKELL